MKWFEVRGDGAMGSWDRGGIPIANLGVLLKHAGGAIVIVHPQ